MKIKASILVVILSILVVILSIHVVILSIHVVILSIHVVILSIHVVVLTLPRHLRPFTSALKILYLGTQHTLPRHSAYKCGGGNRGKGQNGQRKRRNYLEDTKQVRTLTTSIAGGTSEKLKLYLSFLERKYILKTVFLTYLLGKSSVKC